MSYINLAPDQQRAIAGIDVRDLEAAVERCERDGQITPIYALGLSGCGEFIASEYRAFERALAAHSKAKAHAKREQTRMDVLRAGSNLVHAVEQMQERVKTEREQAQLFMVDDQIQAKLVRTIMGQTQMDSFWESPLLIVGTLRNKLSSAHGAGEKAKVVPEHVAKYALNATASAMLFLHDQAHK
ncbi:abortive infection family protein [Pseudomonas chengduensis]|nr:abortive infection family protein [Pseudomonas chengduensis]MDH0625825.1 abortive infection family protein [Pseudomonas chengduensis]MDH1214286.1 abortive infection family protein [Pseudomonas chengduensis]MDH1283616.1 abortive infection family protein [Pseudomonas chengduensis]MDH1668304.1 abortive infection family protein [Pseudomonas chengduensis]MDH1680559.1 abortive infection family protein [Pseudomonas chengduensis]